MITELKSKRCFVAAICSYLFLVTTSQVCFAGAQNNPLINKEAPKLDLYGSIKSTPATAW
jgi:hypothetical protein